MADLRLVYIDKNKNEKTIMVTETVFMVGRGPENDLAISDTRLSREHLKIERFGEVYIAKDVGSSNGTKYNGEALKDPVAVEHGDKFDLGGGLELTALLKDDQADGDDEDAPAAEPITPQLAAAAAAPAPSRSISPLIFLLVPAVGIILLLSVGGIYLLMRDSGTKVVASDDPGYSDSSEGDDGPKNDPIPKKTTDPEASPTPTSGPNVSSSPIGSDPIDGTKTESNGKDPESSVEESGAAFLRRIAQNEPRAFLTGEQSDIVAKKIKQVTSSALADNINSARKNSAKIKEIAAAKNLRPQLIATAAITKLGNQRGDVVQTAQGMVDILAVLGTQIGNEFGDDALMMIAVYDQGAAGDTMKLRNQLQSLTTKFPQSARTIRSIWFLKSNNQITDQEYDFALRFLAIGTITQNPKGFNVNAEPLKL